MDDMYKDRSRRREEVIGEREEGIEGADEQHVKATYVGVKEEGLDEEESRGQQEENDCSTFSIRGTRA